MSKDLSARNIKEELKKRFTKSIKKKEKNGRRYKKLPEYDKQILVD